MNKENSPSLWQFKLPVNDKSAHKYKRGYAGIYGAPSLTGATRLAASACARIGAGLVSVISNPDNALVYKASLPAHIMVRDNMNWFDDRITACLYGSGGVDTSIDFNRSIPTILDADALLNLPNNLGENFVLTPHDAEFKRAFPDYCGERVDIAMKAARGANAMIVLKGAQTVIAHPDGRIVVNSHASPVLASAGTGDVLAGMITGLCAQGMEPYDAACAAVWIHGEASIRIGVGLVASDIPEIIPEVLKNFA